METTNNIGQRIAQIRKSQRLTQEYMAERMRISRTSYNKMENGAKRILSSDLIKMAEILDVSADEILGITSKKSKPVAPKLNLTIEFTDDDAIPDGALVKRLSEMIRRINESE